MKYKEFKGSIEFSEEDDVFFGKILDIKDLVLYEAINIVELDKEFKNAVNDCIEMRTECVKNHIPNKKTIKTINIVQSDTNLNPIKNLDKFLKEL